MIIPKAKRGQYFAWNLAPPHWLFFFERALEYHMDMFKQQPDSKGLKGWLADTGKMFTMWPVLWVCFLLLATNSFIFLIMVLSAFFDAI